MTDAELGAALRRAGLTPRALVAAWGTPFVARLLDAIRPLPATPATAALSLFVAVEPVARDHAERGLGPRALAALVERELVVVEDDAVRARCAMIPVGPSLVCCDNDTWPDDSSHHLVGCLPPGRAARWLDIGTGCGIVPLAAPGRAAAIVGADINPAAVRIARLGAALSDVRHLEVREADLAAGVGTGFDLVTFNAPIPAESGLTDPTDPLFRRAAPGAQLLARLATELPAHLTAEATVVVHTWLGDVTRAVIDALPGEVVVARYTPPDRPAFGIVRWRPGAPAAHRAVHRLPTIDAPHLSWDDLEPAA